MTSDSLPSSSLHSVSKRRPPGWGADLAPENRPAVPMERQPPRLEGVHWTQPERQVPDVKILCSIEHVELPPVFGTTLPPKGASGAVREWAFRHSESDLRHWLLLLLADRIHVGEGILSDLASGRIPNIPAEMGWRAEWRYNRSGALRKLGLVAAVGALIYLRRRRRR